MVQSQAWAFVLFSKRYVGVASHVENEVYRLVTRARLCNYLAFDRDHAR
jgi:hypothetical protein